MVGNWGGGGSWVESSGGGASQHSLELPSGWWFKKKVRLG